MPSTEHNELFVGCRRIGQWHTLGMNKPTLSITCLLVVASFACGREDPGPGMSTGVPVTGAPVPMPSANAPAGYASTEAPAPLLCDVCASQPGGDTSDIGGMPICRGHWAIEDGLKLDEAEAEGFDLESALVGVEGDFEAEVRWDLPQAPQTRLRAEVARTGKASILRWVPAPEDPLPECDTPDQAAAEVEVRIATDDGRVAGSFSVERSIRRGRTYDRMPLRYIELEGDASQLRGTLALPSPTGEGASLWVTLAVRETDEGPRMALALTLREFVADDVGDRVLEAVEALPPDGCIAAHALYLDVSPSRCRPPRFSESGCCLPPWYDAESDDQDGGRAFEPDADAGTD